MEKGNKSLQINFCHQNSSVENSMQGRERYNFFARDSRSFILRTRKSRAGKFKITCLLNFPAPFSAEVPPSQDKRAGIFMSFPTLFLYIPWKIPWFFIYILPTYLFYFKIEDKASAAVAVHT